MTISDIDLGRYSLGWRDPEDYVFRSKRGLDQSVVEEMTWMKGEPDWMRQFRLKSLKHFDRRPMPTWAATSAASISTRSFITSSQPTSK